MRDLDDRLLRLQENLRRRAKLDRGLAETRATLAAAERELRDLGATLEREQQDVAKLEGFSMSGLLVGLFGDKDERLDRERKELAVAKLAYDERLEATASLGAEIERIERDRDALGDLDAEREQVFAAREAALRAAGGAAARELGEVLDALAAARSDQRETREALTAADAALVSIRECADTLGSARNWGRFDLVGGNFLANWAKHGKLNDARRLGNQVQRQLRTLNRELHDLDAQQPLGFEIGGFLTFADWFFDGFVSDFLVQRKIAASCDRVEALRERVQRVASELRVRNRETGARAAALADRRQEILEG